MLTEKVLYRAQVTATGGRYTRAVSSDGVLDLTVTSPRELGGANGPEITSEQLFAASYAVSFLAVMRLVAGRESITLPRNTGVEASVGLGQTPRGFGIEVELRICLPGLVRAEADLLVEKSHALCPYSNALRGNVSVRLVFA
jgi:osmotically inducible protein OsmC